jgi:predicted 3-demethylubiquinone-9 3-methyltransferase (glyoxalase superfamily)
MFCGPPHGKAEEAINWYCSIFPGSQIVAIDRYGPGQEQPEGTVRSATFQLGGKPVKAIDAAGPHAFSFTPAISMWVECSSAAELDRMAASLGEGGTQLMPLGDYGFSQRFGWVADRYGVTWQLNLAHGTA